MPNWCSNKLIIRGDISAFVGQVGDSFTLRKFYPIPKELTEINEGSIVIDGKTYERWIENSLGHPRGLDEDTLRTYRAQYGADGWYHWSISNWGTKWDIDETRYLLKDEEFLCHFDSAWSPPLNWMEHVSANFPSLLFELYYAEGGCGFYGYSHVKNGKVLQNFESTKFWSDSSTGTCTDHCQSFLDEHGLHRGA